METISSSINTSSPEFKDNAKHHRALAYELKQRIALVHEGGGEKYRARQESQGKLFVRERIDRLDDPNSPFLELLILILF
jgi:acetyl-CoA carboxylase carboxyltransferase component